jgi:hypothetical protein
VFSNIISRKEGILEKYLSLLRIFFGTEFVGKYDLRIGIRGMNGTALVWLIEEINWCRWILLVVTASEDRVLLRSCE